VTGEGPLPTTRANKVPAELSLTEVELGALHDMVPATGEIRHAQAFISASTAIVQSLQS
jgi:hypothetical protein